MANIKNKILVLAIFFVSLLHSGVALAIHDRITEKAYFEDKTGAQSLDQVIDASFTPLDGLLNKGYSKSVYWMRLNYEPGAPDQRLILRILPPFIDEITIYQVFYSHIKRGVSCPIFLCIFIIFLLSNFPVKNWECLINLISICFFFILTFPTSISFSFSFVSTIF